MKKVPDERKQLMLVTQTENICRSAEKEERNGESRNQGFSIQKQAGNEQA